MSENQSTSGLLKGYLLGQIISDHQGVRCSPALQEATNQRHIVKTISIPASQTQLDALLLSGAYRDAEQAQEYFKELVQALAEENDLLTRLSKQEGFLGYEGLQVRAMESGIGYEVTLISPYRPALDRQMTRAPLTQLAAVNLGLDMCAALSICRQAGYLYADLKPSNIYSTDTRGYCIGDLGFIPMTSLKYASLPEKYRSSYTAPEISDAFAALNDTLDVYALGLVLYQVYNNGQLPFTGTAPQEKLLPPAYADYEMAQIILKACDPNPTQRWSDPEQMRQELVNYMQRNGVEDVPIIPPPVEIIDETEPENEFLTEEENDAELEKLLALIPDEEPIDYPEDAAPSDGNQDSTENKLTEDGVTAEVAQILAQADELIEHELPEPAVAPEPIDVPIPPPLSEQVEVQDEPEEEESSVPTPVEEEDSEVPAPIPMEEDEEEEEKTVPPRFHISRRMIGLCAALVLLLGLCFGIFFYYQHHYLQTIDTLTIQGDFDKVTVLIRSDADESLLSVSCSDNYGNTLRASVIDGKATFSGLKPNYQYRIQVHISGRHKLMGSISGTYTATYPENYFQTIDALSATSTDTQIFVTLHTNGDEKLLSILCTDPEGVTQKCPIIGGKATFTGLNPNTLYSLSLQIQGEHELKGQTSVSCETKPQVRVQNMQFLTGSQDGSLLVQINAEGDPGLWTIYYGPEGQEPQSITIASNYFELYNLQVGVEYLFRLEAPGAYLAGETVWPYIPQSLLLPQDIRITACGNGTVGLEWTASDGSANHMWQIHCFNNAGFDQTITVAGNAAQIDNLDDAQSYTITVTAQGMSKGNTISVTANPIAITGFMVENITDATMDFVWGFDGNAPLDGWILTYSIDGGEQVQLTCTESKATLPLTIGAVYDFHLSPATETTCINADFQYTAQVTPEVAA